MRRTRTDWSRRPLRPRQRQAPPSPRRLRRLWRLFLASAVLAAIAGALWWVSQSPFFRIDTVTVEGAQTLEPEYVEQVAGLEGQNIFRAQLGEVKERLLAEQIVKDVSVSRRWPDGIHISIVERQPWGYWQIDARRYVVDSDGIVMYRVLPPEGAPTILDFTGEHGDTLESGDWVDADAVHLAQKLIETAPAYLGMTATGFEYRSEDGLTATLENAADNRSLRATFGDGRDLNYKLAVLSALLQRTAEEGRLVHRVDLRFGERVSFQ